MTLNEYQTAAMRTASGTSTANNENLILNGAMGLNGESGEIIDMLKKNMFQGHELDKEHLAKECGDVLWYCAILAKGLGYGLDEIAQMNVDKLRKRYPDGFSTERSVNREKGDI